MIAIQNWKLIGLVKLSVIFGISLLFVRVKKILCSITTYNAAKTEVYIHCQATLNTLLTLSDKLTSDFCLKNVTDFYDNYHKKDGKIVFVLFFSKTFFPICSQSKFNPELRPKLVFKQVTRTNKIIHYSHKYVS